MDHPSQETLKRFASGTASREESRTVVAHLLKGCAECSAKLKALLKPEAVIKGAYDQPLERFDRWLLAVLEMSISPMETVRRVTGLLPRPEKKR